LTRKKGRVTELTVTVATTRKKEAGRKKEGRGHRAHEHREGHCKIKNRGQNGGGKEGAGGGGQRKKNNWGSPCPGGNDHYHKIIPKGKERTEKKNLIEEKGKSP